jgi:hypothetical protein
VLNAFVRGEKKYGCESRWFRSLGAPKARPPSRPLWSGAAGAAHRTRAQGTGARRSWAPSCGAPGAQDTGTRAHAKGCAAAGASCTGAQAPGTQGAGPGHRGAPGTGPGARRSWAQSCTRARQLCTRDAGHQGRGCHAPGAQRGHQGAPAGPRAAQAPGHQSCAPELPGLLQGERTINAGRSFR